MSQHERRGLDSNGRRGLPTVCHATFVALKRKSEDHGGVHCAKAHSLVGLREVRAARRDPYTHLLDLSGRWLR